MFGLYRKLHCNNRTGYNIYLPTNINEKKNIIIFSEEINHSGQLMLHHVCIQIDNQTNKFKDNVITTWQYLPMRAPVIVPILISR